MSLFTNRRRGERTDHSDAGQIAPARPTVSRRRLLGAAGVGAVAGAGVAVGVPAAARAVSSEPSAGLAYPFYGEHQAGIVTPAQDRLHFTAFDLTTTSWAEVVRLLKAWTVAAERMTRGAAAGEFGATGGPYDGPPDDTGESLGLPPSGLTLTFGFGPSLFEGTKGVTLGLAGKRPAALADIPKFPGDTLDAAQSGGDLCVQACANDPQVAVHAIRNLARIAFGTAAVRWSQLGFGRTSSTSTSQETPRNLFGFKDGTANVKSEEATLVNDHVWAHGSDGTAWMAGGSYLVARKIRMIIETWDRTSLREQEAIIGRDKGAGAPMSGGTEFTEPDFARAGREGKPLIAEDSHVRLAHHTRNSGARILRRGYNFVDGSDNVGHLNAGLFFLAYQRDPRSAFIPMQTQLARSDALNEYIRHVGSAVFAVPPGVRASGDYIGSGLFG